MIYSPSSRKPDPNPKHPFLLYEARVPVLPPFTLCFSCRLTLICAFCLRLVLFQPSPSSWPIPSFSINSVQFGLVNLWLLRIFPLTCASLHGSPVSHLRFASTSSLSYLPRSSALCASRRICDASNLLKTLPPSHFHDGRPTDYRSKRDLLGHF